MITVSLTEKQNDRMAVFFRKETDIVTEQLMTATPADLPALAKDLSELASLAAKFEAAKAVASSPRLAAVPSGSREETATGDAGPPTKFYSTAPVAGSAMDAGPPRRATK